MTPVSEISMARLKRLAGRAFDESREAMLDSIRLRFEAAWTRERIACEEHTRPIARVARGTESHYPLSSREQQVLIMVAEGKTTRQIAEAMGISFKTVSSHRSAIMSKLSVHKSAALIREAYRLGLMRS